MSMDANSLVSVEEYLRTSYPSNEAKGGVLRAESAHIEISLSEISQ
jgi:hypothetical protein